MQKKIILFENICSEVLGKHGNRWNSKKYIDVTMLATELKYGDLDYEFYSPTHEEIAKIATEVFDQGVEDPCIVAVRERETDAWQILWGKEYDLVATEGPVLFNVKVSMVSDRTDNIMVEHKYLEKDEYMLSWTHFEYNWYDVEGYYAVYKKCPLCDSVRYDQVSSMPARTLDFAEVARQLNLKELTLDAMRSLPAVTEGELEYGYRVVKPSNKPCFITIEGKILCDSHNASRVPYLYNAEGYANDGYVKRKTGDIMICEDEWREGGIGVRFRKGHVEDWR